MSGITNINPFSLGLLLLLEEGEQTLLNKGQYYLINKFDRNIIDVLYLSPFRFHHSRG